MSSTILALDLGTKTGWAMGSFGNLICSGTRVDKPGRYDGGGMRYLRFRGWLLELRAGQSFDVVYFEEVRRHMSTDSAHVYGGFLAHLTAWCEEHKVPYEGLPVGTIKKEATGKGNAGKDQVISAMVKRWGVKPVDDNEADALAILHCAFVSRPTATLPRQRRIFKG